MVGIGQGTWLAETLPRILGQGTGNEAIETGGQIIAPATERGNRRVQMLLGNFFGGGASKDRRAGQQSKQHRAEGVHIGICSDRLAQELLGSTGAIPLREGRCQSLFLARQDQIPHTKVGHHQLSIEPDENTVNREAAMQHGMLVGILQGGGDLIQVATNGEDI